MLARSLRWSTAVALGGIAVFGCGRDAPLTGTEPSFAHIYRLRGLYPGKAHTVRIVATDRMGAAEPAPDASFTTYDADPAFSPDALRVVAESGAAPGYRLFDYARWPEQL